MKPSNFCNRVALTLLLAGQAVSAVDLPPIEEIIVSAELLEQDALKLPLSVSVIDQQAIARRSAYHLEDLLNLAPNVNYSTGASRGRFIQIRGIGERSEFRDPVNYSVGLLLDGIDLTGIAGGASTLDTAQVEILRGPQGTLFGANALAGMINIVSNRPTAELSGSLSTAVEEYGGLQLGGVLSGPLSDSAGFRLALSHYESDGYTDNLFLNRDDTNNIDETSVRLRYSQSISEALELDFIVYGMQVRNGYDAFSLDNTRNTYSDQPGADEQDTLAGSLQLGYTISDALTLEAAFSATNSELAYGYDEDWSHTGICDNTECDSDRWGYDWFYSSTDNYRRDNDNRTVDVRLQHSTGGSLSWLAGMYHRDQKTELQQIYTYQTSDYLSRLDTENTAAYTQLDVDLNESWSVTTGLRYEYRRMDFKDSAQNQASPSEDLWGGKLALQYKAATGTFVYGLVSRGYKAGGFNLDEIIPDERREFDTETMLNYELGIKQSLLDDRLRLQLAVFYQDRSDVQSKQSILRDALTGVIDPDCSPCTFTDFTTNATSGENAGLELDLQWLASDGLQLFASLGLLNSEYGDYLSCEHVEADCENGQPYNLKGRGQSHAPEYQFTLGGRWDISEHWRLSTSLEGKDAFYFSDRHSEQSDRYELVNLELAYHTEQLEVALYGKNIGDETVKTRGFGSFGNDPRKLYIVEPYNQFAAPRVIGLKASYKF